MNLLRPLEELAERWRSPEWAYAHLGPASDKPTEDICADELERVLRESGLADLLEAGQAMYSCDLCTAGLRFQANLPDAHWDDAKNVFAGWCKKKRWDAALAKVKGK